MNLKVGDEIKINKNNADQYRWLIGDKLADAIIAEKMPVPIGTFLVSDVDQETGVITCEWKRKTEGAG